MLNPNIKDIDRGVIALLKPNAFETKRTSQ